MSDMDKLSDKQWEIASVMLQKHVQDDSCHGIMITAPSNPESGTEPNICFYLENDDMVWDEIGTPYLLSDLIIANNRDCKDEMVRARNGLINTMKVLDVWIAARYGRA